MEAVLWESYGSLPSRLDFVSISSWNCWLGSAFIIHRDLDVDGCLARRRMWKIYTAHGEAVDCGSASRKDRLLKDAAKQSISLKETNETELRNRSPLFTFLSGLVPINKSMSLGFADARRMCATPLISQMGIRMSTPCFASVTNRSAGTSKIQCFLITFLNLNTLRCGK